MCVCVKPRRGAEPADGCDVHHRVLWRPGVRESRFSAEGLGGWTFRVFWP